MSDSPKKNQEQADANEKLWGEVVEVVRDNANLVQKIDFNRYKLNYSLTIQQLSQNADNQAPDKRINKEYLEEHLAVIESQREQFKQHYKESMVKLSELQEKYSEGSRALITIDAANKNMVSLYAYVEHKPPAFDELKSQVRKVETRPTTDKPEEEEPSQNLN
jgi:hypothetical protein